jgi:hypothetical protein
MQFLSRFLGSAPKPTPVRNGDRSRRRSRAMIGVESLEGRELLSGDIAGVSFQSGTLAISGTQADHNTAQVAIDSADGMVKVTLNGQSAEYNPSDVWTLTYTGAQGGWDSFTNDTDLTTSVILYGGNNTSLGGSVWNTVTLWGDNNTYDARHGASNVSIYNGNNNNIIAYDNVTVTNYNYDPNSWW